MGLRDILAPQNSGVYSFGTPPVLIQYTPSPTLPAISLLFKKIAFGTRLAVTFTSDSLSNHQTG